MNNIDYLSLDGLNKYTNNMKNYIDSKASGEANCSVRTNIPGGLDLSINADGILEITYREDL